MKRSTIILLLIGAFALGKWHCGRKVEVQPAQVTPAQEEPAPAPQPATPDPVYYANALQYARAQVSVSRSGNQPGLSDTPGLLLRINNAGNRNLSFLSVKATGYGGRAVYGGIKEQGKEFVVELGLKKYPAGKSCEAWLRFPKGVVGISPSLTIQDARF